MVAANTVVVTGYAVMAAQILLLVITILLQLDNSSCLWFDECGICGGDGIPNGTVIVINQTDAIGMCGGDCISDTNSNGVYDNEEVYGCTYDEAINYNSSATLDNGT